MFRKQIIAATVAAAFAMPFGVHAAGDGDLAQIREELKRMKEAYERRIEALEQRLQQAEAAAGKAEASAAKAETAAVAASSRPASESAFNPAVSLILQGSYNNFSKDPDTFRIGGFIPGGGEGLGKRGLSLGESELSIAANIDPYFRGNLTASITPEDTIEVEEAYFQTLGLSNGLTLKGGRFFSGIGYLNEIHQHAWDFVDAPLAYQAFLGTGARGNFGDEGVQVKWVAPTELFVELGAEAGRGRAFPGSDRNKNGTGLATVFAHLGGDIGTSTSWRAGLSHLRTSPQNRPYNDVDSAGNAITNNFTGNSRLWIGDFIVKWAPNGNSTQTNFKLQGEYFRRTEDGALAFDTDGVSGVLAGPAPVAYLARQSGWYLQGAYQFAPRWRVGLRHDRLNFGNVSVGSDATGTLTGADFPLLAAHDPKRSTLMFDYSPSEFSRIRVQWARDQSHPGGVTDNQVFVQYLYSLGAHGAHKF